MLACLGTYQGKELLDSVIGVCLILKMSNCLPVCWIILHSYQPVFKSHFTFTFQQNPWLPTYIFPWRNRKNIWTSEKLQDSVSLPVWTQANFSFEHEVLLGHFASWFWHVSDTEDSLWAECHLGILSIGSDVYLTSRTICEHGVLFGHFCQLIWHVSTIEGQFVNTECYLGILSIDLTCVMSETVCVGQVFIRSSSWGTCDSLSSGVWVYIPFVCWCHCCLL